MRWAPLPLTLRQLQYAVAVAETGSFRRAAELCHVAQPSLSAQIAELERSLGVTLFERDKRRVLSTPAGIEIVQRAQRALAAATDVVDAARRHVDPLTGTLRIGIIPTVGPYLLPEAVPLLRKAFPHLTIAWTEEKTGDLVSHIRTGDLDAAVLAEGPDLGDLEVEKIGEDAFVLLAPKGHELTRSRGALAPEDLAGHRVLLLDDGHCMRDQALAVCSTSNAEELGFRATSLSTLVQMVAGGAAVTLLPRIALATERQRADLRVRELVAPAPFRTLVLAARKSSPISPALHAIAVVLAAAVATASR